MPSIRPARPAEADRLTEIALAAKRHWGYPETWMDAWRDALAFTPDGVEAHLVHVATEADDVPVACVALSVDGDAVELEHLWVEPAAMGRGLGRALFEHAVRVARDAGGTALFIDSDPFAEPFYQRMGAERVGWTRADVLGERRELPRLRFDL
ncbi:GNAT family N-acetyltransferase [Rubrivirga marina]|uniref:N-acetyltransferase domain-containing protein n=1 Tax=Rubrivirga marina TaxID=1196024 RepID=A0A271IXE0_9BACT|nr:GNAT family N-acetyltransferase [Rubrivirga marina]PAP75608.1 hypothetical protein BSZ37_03745 [Rubrivirga marina]